MKETFLPSLNGTLIAAGFAWLAVPELTPYVGIIACVLFLVGSPLGLALLEWKNSSAADSGASARSRSNLDSALIGGCLGLRVACQQKATPECSDAIAQQVSAGGCKQSPTALHLFAFADACRIALDICSMVSKPRVLIRTAGGLVLRSPSGLLEQELRESPLPKLERGLLPCSSVALVRNAAVQWLSLVKEK